MACCKQDLRSKVKRSGWINAIGFLVYAIICIIAISSISDEFLENLARNNDGVKVPVREILGIFVAVFIVFAICAVGVIIGEKNEKPMLLLPHIAICGILIILILCFTIYISTLKFVDVTRPRGAICIIFWIVAIIAVLIDAHKVFKLYRFFKAQPQRSPSYLNL